MLGPSHRPRRALVAVALFTVLGAGSAPSAHAAPTWVAPIPLGTFGPGVNHAYEDVAVDPAGNTTVIWKTSAAGVMWSTRPAGGTFSTPKAIPGSTEDQSELPKMAVDGNGTVIVLWMARPTGAKYIARYSVKPAGGTFGPSADVSDPAKNAFYVSIAMNAAGVAVMTWSQELSDPAVAQAVVRQPNGTTSAPQTLSAAGASPGPPDDNFNAAVSPQGDVLVMWNRIVAGNPVAEAAIRRAGTSSFSAPITLGGGTKSRSARAAFDSAGNATVVYNECSATCSVKARYRAAGAATTFGAAATLGASDDGAQPVIAVEPDGTAVVAWPGGGRIQTAVRVLNLAWSASQPLSPVGGAPTWPRVAFDANGGAIVAWVRDGGQGTVVETSLRPRNGSFGPVQTVSGTGVTPFWPPELGVDASGNAALAWTRSTGPGAGTSTITEVAGLDGAPPKLSGVTIPATATAGIAAAFSATATDTWSPVTLSWDFGDGSSSTGASVQHAFTVGTFGVKVTANDGVGNSVSANGPLQVAAAPTPTPTPTPDPGTGGGGGSPLPAPSGVDADRDGFFAGQDCNDNDSKIRPGALEIKGNRIDENCDGVAEAYSTVGALVTTKWSVNGSALTLSQLNATQLPTGFKVELRCAGSRCPFKKLTLKATARNGAANLLSKLKKPQRKFRAGQTVQVWVSAPGLNTKVSQFKLKKGKIPSSTPLCVAVGQTTPVANCS